MTEDERQRQMDFILNQQAQFAADIQKLQEGQAKLQEGQAKLQESQAQLQESQAKLQETQAAQLEMQVESAQVVKRLAAVTLEGFKQTKAQIDALIDAQMRTEGSLTKLAEAQTHTDQRLDTLIDIIREWRNGKS